MNTDRLEKISKLAGIIIAIFKYPFYKKMWAGVPPLM
jgi:hypothetical protein